MSRNTRTVLLESLVPPVPEKFKLAALVRLSVLDEPESVAAAKSGALGVVGVTLTEMVRVAVPPFPSLTCTVKESVPAYPVVGV